MTKVPPSEAGHADDPAAAGNGRSRVPGDMDEISLVALVNVLLRQRRVLVGVPAALVVLAVALTILFGSGTFTAESRFMLQASDEAVNPLASFAAQLGVLTAAGRGGESLAFYADLLESRGILRDAATTTYRFATGPSQRDTLEGTLVDLYRIEAPDPAPRIRAAMGLLNEAVNVSAAPESGMLILETAAPWPELAVQLNRRLLELVNEFNLQKRQTRARAEREFIEERMQVARQELAQAEAALKLFLQQNRRFQDSPDLVFEQMSLQRRVDLRQEVYLSLAKSYEQARIEEVRNTPVITVVEAPEGSVRGGGSLFLNLVLSLFLGCVFGVALAFLREHMSRQRREHPETCAEFDALRRAAIGDLHPRRLWRAIRAIGNGTRRAAGSEHGAVPADAVEGGQATETVRR